MREELIAVFDRYIDEYFPKGDKRRGEVLLIGGMIIAKALELQESTVQKVTTIASDDDRVGRVAELLQEFMKQANSVEYWQGERSGRGFVRGWARKIIKEVQS